jgi:PilZ domain
MKVCPDCNRSYATSINFCVADGVKLVESESKASENGEESKNQRRVPPPPEPLPMRLRIIDQSDEGNRSRVIQGLAIDLSQQGMRIQTGTVETGHLNIIRDHTVAFKNKLEVEIDLPRGTVKLNGVASWYKPSGDGVNWMVGVYIRDMPSADRHLYDEYLADLSKHSERAASEP